MVSLKDIPFAVYTWRASPAAVLPLVLLQSLAFGLNGLPIFYTFRSIRCEQFEGPFPPDIDVCRLPAVQKAYNIDIAIYTTILTVLGILLSGPYGTFSDVRGRKRALAVACGFLTLGDFWLFICSLSPVLRQPWLLQLTAVIQGFGGGFSVILAAQNAFIADTSSPSTRSFYMGLSLVMYWCGSAFGPLISAPLLGRKLYTVNFGFTVDTWILYLLYLFLFLRETREIPAANTHLASDSQDASPSGGAAARQSTSSARLLFETVVDPLKIIFTHSSLLIPCLSLSGAILAVGAFNMILPYCDYRFGMTPNEAGLVSSVLSISRAASVLCILPIFRAIYARTWAATDVAAPDAAAHERTPLLLDPELPAGSSEPQGDVDSEPQGNVDSEPLSSRERKSEEALAQEELVIARGGLVLDAVGMILTWLSRSTAEASLSTVVGSLGAPAGPSMQALITLAAPPGEMGRVLAGLSVLESLAVALRSPMFVPLFNATLEKVPGAVWWLSAVIFTMCSVLMFFLRPGQFVQSGGMIP